MNTMEITKIVAGLCTALLIYCLLFFFTEFIYVSDSHSGEGVERAYVIATGEGEEEQDLTEEVALDVDALMAAADPVAGEDEFKPCQACHKLGAGENGVGPTLFGVVGRDIGSADGYAYSDELTSLPGDWNPENLINFLANPKEYAPGTKMVFRGIRSPEDRANLIAYLDSLDD